MATLFNTKISNTYVGLLKTIDNAVINATLRELTDGSGNQSGLYINTAGDFKATGTLEWGTLKDTGENIYITKFVDEADGIANNDNDTTIPTSAAVVDYVAARITLEDLDFSGDSGTGSVDLDSQTFAVVGTANEIETSAGSQQLQIGLPDNVTIGGNLQVNGLLKGNNNIVIKDTSDRTMAAFYGGGKSELYFNDSKKFETTSDGATVTGGLTATGGSVFTGATFSSNVTWADGAKGLFGNSSDLEVFHNGTSYIQNNTGTLRIIQNLNDGDIQLESDDGSGGLATYMTIDGGAERNIFSKSLRILDDVQLDIGTSDDFRIVHTSANNNTYVQNFTGHLYITNKSDDKDIIFQTDDGSGNDATYLYLDGSQSSSGNLYVKYPDNSRITLGDGSDLYFWHDGTDTQMQNSGGHLVFTQATDDKDMIFKCDDGSGGFTEYFKLDGSQTEVVFSKAIHSNGNIYVGDNKDLYIFHNGNDSYIQQVGTGDLIITQNVADRDIVFKSDDGSGGETEYFRLDGSVARVEASKSFRFIDNIQANFGSSGDLGIYHNGTDSYIVNGTGDLEIINNNDNGDISFISDNGSGSTTEYLRVDGGIESLVASKDLLMAIDGNGGKIKFGASQDLEIYHDGSNSHIDDTGTGNLVLRGNAAISLQKYTGENLAMFNADGGVDLYHDDSKKFETTTGGIVITGTTSSTDTIAVTGTDANIKVDSDTGKFIAGTGNDLQIYHDGSNSYIKDAGTGILYIQADNQLRLDCATTGEKFARFYKDGQVELFYDNALKFETISGGASVTGSLGINTTSPSRNLSVHRDSAGSVANFLHYTDGSNFSGLYIDVSQDSDEVILNASGSSGAATIFKQGNNTSLTLATNLLATFAGSVIVSGDLTVNGTTTTVNTSTLAVEDPLISMAKDNSANSVDIGFYGRYNDGSNRYLGLFADASDTNRFKLFKGTTTEPTTTVDTSATGYEYANLLLASVESRGNIKITNASSPHLEITDTTNTCTFKAYAQDSNAHIGTMTNHSFVIDTNGTAAITLDTSQNATFAGNVNLADSKNLKLGAGQDLELFHNGTDSYIQNSTGDLEIINYADDKRIEFKCDDGSGGVETYFYCDGAGGGSQPFTVFPDSAVLAMGTNHDTYIQHTGSVGKIDNYTGDFEITNHTDDGNLLLRCDNGSGGTAAYVQLDGGETKTIFLKDTRHNDNVAAIFGTGQDLQIFHDGSHSRIKDVGSGHLTINATDFVVNNSADTKNMIIASDGGSVNLYYNASQKFRTVSAGVEITGDISNASSHFTITSADDFVLDAAGKINLDADGGLIRFKDDGTEIGTLDLTGGFAIKSSVSDADFFIQGNDGGSIINALQLDMSDSGFAIFNYGVKAPFFTSDGGRGFKQDGVSFVHTYSNGSDGDAAGDLGSSTVRWRDLYLHGDIEATDSLTIDVTGDLSLDASGNDIRFKVNGVEYGKFKDDSDDFAIFSSIQDKDILFKGNDGGSTITALTLDMSNAGSATFNDDIDLGGKITQTGTSGTNTLNTHLNIASGNLGIGDTTPDFSIEINQDNPQIRLEENTTGGSKRLDLKVNTSTSNAEIGANQSAQSLILQTAGSDRLTIRSDGRIGIGNAGYSSSTVGINAGTDDDAIYATSTDANCFATFRDTNSTSNVAYGARGDDHVLRKDNADYFIVNNVGDVYNYQSVNKGNTFYGYAAGDYSAAGGSNTFMGYNVANNLSSGTQNVGIGRDVFISTLTGSSNTAIGTNAAQHITSGNNNVAVGFSALETLTEGTENTAVGWKSLEAATTSSGNTAVGLNSLTSTTVGDLNVAVGTNALRYNVNGDRAVAIGYNALQAQAPTSANTDTYNVAIGLNSQFSVTTGTFNTTVGGYTMANGTDSSYNVAVGYGTLHTNITGDNNVAIGYNAGHYLTSANNTIVGHTAGDEITTGDTNLVLGYAAGSGSSPFQLTTQNNRIILGSNATTDAYIKIDWTVTSDKRDKTDFEEIPIGLDFVNKLKPTEFKFRKNRNTEETDGKRRYGFIAQEILELEGDDSVIIDAEQEHILKYKQSHLVPVLVKAIQELKAEVDSLKKQCNCK